MLNYENKLYVYHDDDSSFSDYSYEALDFARDTFTIEMVAADDYLYVGYRKPINAFYVDFDTANTNANTLAGEYYNGSSWTAMTELVDETKGFTRSGFIQWERPTDPDDQVTVTVNSQSAYWYRFKPSADHSSTVINGLNIVFADDEDLKKEWFEVTNHRASGEDSFILTHVACRDDIIQHFRNESFTKRDPNTERLENLDAFDLLDIKEIRVAAKHLALHKIYMNLSDSVDDVYFQKATYHRSMYGDAINLAFLTFDHDDDGVKDAGDRIVQSHGMIKRL